ncbi:MAG: ankyrin repeat domain-containing protein [Armatimonadota bacterium]
MLIIAIIIAAYGITMDLLSMIWAIRRNTADRGPSGILLFPLILYLVAIILLPVNAGIKAALFGGSFIFHVLTHFGIPMIYEKWWFNSRPSLHKAVLRKNNEEVQHLLESGENVNIKDNVGVTPLHIAARRGYYEIVELLLEHEADKYSTLKDGTTTPIILAKLCYRTDIEELLKDK